MLFDRIEKGFGRGREGGVGRKRDGNKNGVVVFESWLKTGVKLINDRMERKRAEFGNI